MPIASPALPPRPVSRRDSQPEPGAVASRPRAATLALIAAKVERGERLTLADGEVLFATPDLYTVCELADKVRRRLHGDKAFYNINRHVQSWSRY